MKYANKRLKQQLRQAETLPEGFAWADMQGGIYEAMEETNAASNTAQRRNLLRKPEIS